MPKVNYDFLITGGGSTVLLTPVSKQGMDWCEENFDQFGGEGSYSMSPQDITQIVHDIKEDGLKVQWQYR